jgi:diguanylate cyclase (GGDEF)-like protein
MRVCQAAEKISGRAVGIVVRDPVSLAATVVLTSPGADRRLLNTTVQVDSAAGRACAGMLTTATSTGRELLGPALSGRRRERQGVAFPLVAQAGGVGALIVFGPPDSLDERARDELVALARDGGPLLDGAIQSGLEARQRVTDMAVGLPNRWGLEEALERRAYAPCSMIRVELEQLDRVVCHFGPHAGRAVLRQAAGLLRSVMRADDVAAHLEGPAFALLLLDCHEDEAHAVLERLSDRIKGSSFHWDGLEFNLRCSAGIASVPEHVRHPAALLLAAERALATHGSAAGA